MALFSPKLVWDKHQQWTKLQMELQHKQEDLLRQTAMAQRIHQKLMSVESRPTQNLRLRVHRAWGQIQDTALSRRIQIVHLQSLGLSQPTPSGLKRESYRISGQFGTQEDLQAWLEDLIAAGVGIMALHMAQDQFDVEVCIWGA